MQRTALFSLYDTDRVGEFAGGLVSMGWRIIATQETTSILSKAGIPSQDISEFTGVTRDYGIPPTLHPKIENSLTMENPEDRIDLVYDIPYPLETGNDVGGRVLLALAAKGKRIPVASIEDMQRVVELIKTGADLPADLVAELIDKTNAMISAHYLNVVKSTGHGVYDGQVGRQVYPLQNGENPYQAAELFASDEDDSLALHRFHNLSDTSPCFTNLADSDALVNTLCLAHAAFKAHFGKAPYLAAASKHGNVCGISYDWNLPLPALERTLFGNPLAVWGGELATNFIIDQPLSEVMVKHPRREALLGSAIWMLDVVIAPEYSKGATDTLLNRKFRKVFANPALVDPQPAVNGYAHRFVRGGFLRQSPPWKILDLKEAVRDGNKPDDNDVASLILAWVAAYTSFHGGNEVALVKDGRLIGVGGGPATVQAAEVAVDRAKKAGHSTEGSVFCADAFFPFTDGPQILIDAGVKMGCVPAGGKNEPEVRQAFSKASVNMFYLPEDFRGFCRH